MEHELMTMKEAAAYLRLSVATLASMKKNGDVPFIRLGRRIMFRKETLLNFVASKEVTKPTLN